MPAMSRNCYEVWFEIGTDVSHTGFFTNRERAHRWMANFALRYLGRLGDTVAAASAASDVACLYVDGKYADAWLKFADALGDGGRLMMEEKGYDWRQHEVEVVPASEICLMLRARVKAMGGGK